MMRRSPTVPENTVEIAAGDVRLEGNLALPAGARAVVLFAHGSGSSRFSPRNRYVAGALNEAGLGTLLFDLLTPGEETADAVRMHIRFNIPFLAGRLAAATDWALRNETTRDLRIGYFGASTGAEAALMASVERTEAVGAIVSRGGRPDLAAPVLGRVKAPTLLIVGGRDEVVIALNRTALAQLTGEKRLVIVPGATHLFEEPGALVEVARLSAEWFVNYLHHNPTLERR